MPPAPADFPTDPAPADFPTDRITRRHVIKKAALAALMLGAADLLSACGSSSGSSLESLQKAGSVTIGYDSDPPWSFTTTSGKVTGIAAEVADATWKSLDVPNVKTELVDFGDLIPGVVAGRFDSIGDTLFVTPVRCKAVLFSDPFAVDGEALAVASGNPKGLSDFKSVAEKSARLGIVSGSTEESFARDAGVRSSKISSFGDVTTAIQALGAGRVDAVAYDVVALQYSVSSSHAKAEVTPAFTAMLNGKPVYGANSFIFKKSNGPLVTAFNKAQAKLIESGEVADIASRFVKGLDAGIAQAQHLTVAQLCA